MARFYDPKDEKELARVEAILRHGGIEYSVRCAGDGNRPFSEIHVAEEDLPRADKLVKRHQPH